MQDPTRDFRSVFRIRNFFPDPYLAFFPESGSGSAKNPDPSGSGTLLQVLPTIRVIVVMNLFSVI